MHVFCGHCTGDYCCMQLRLTDAVLQMKNFCGCEKQKLELKYDTFMKRYALEEEVNFGRHYKMKAAMNSGSVCSPLP